MERKKVQRLDKQWNRLNFRRPAWGTIIFQKTLRYQALKAK